MLESIPLGISWNNQPGSIFGSLPAHARLLPWNVMEGPIRIKG